MRTFIAVELDEDIKRALQRLLGTLQKSGADVRWVNSQGMHLTLKFLGEVDADGITSVKEILKTVSSRHSRFSLVIKGTGTFPGGKNPRVLWVGIEADPELPALQEDLETELQRAGFPREDRAFHAHLTLGRVRSSQRIREAVAELEKRQEINFGAMTALKVTLFQSILKPQGAEYKVVEEFALP